MENYDFEEGLEDNESDPLVKLKLVTRNARLVDARMEMGITQRELQQAIGISVAKIGKIENLRLIPSISEQERIAAYLRQPVDYFFPDTLMKAIEEGVFARRDVQLAEPQIVSLTEAIRLRVAYDGEAAIMDEIDRHLLSERLDGVLSSLEPRERKVIELRFGLGDGHSRSGEAVGNIFHISRSRIHQIEHKALRKLRHSSRSMHLSDYLE